MYVEFKPGEKYAGNDAEISETHEAFTDCGLLLTDDMIVVDIDHLPKDAIKALIRDFNLQTMTVWTDRGAHLYFRKPSRFKRKKDGVCKLGFEVEQHTSRSRPNGLTIKRNGVLRQIDHQGKMMYMPEIFDVQGGKNPYKNLTGMEEGDGRNKALFEHRKMLMDRGSWQKMLRFINEHVFAEALSEEEFQGIIRDVDLDKSKDDKFWVAEDIMRECRTVIYSGAIWWYRNGEYLSDDGNRELIRRIYQKAEGENSRYVDEVIKQIEYRSPIIPDDAVFPIRFRNGILDDGEFIECRDYTEFTPYFIDIEYDPNAEPVTIVNDYIKELTSGDIDYIQLLMEVIGYVMITDPERIRSLGKFFMFRGDGANGKGTLLQIMKRIYNAKNCTNLSIKQLVDDRFKVTMIGKLANLGDDIEPEAIDNKELKILKNISTADTVSTRRLYAQSESATFTIKLYFTTNSDIASFEKGYAYRRRIVWLPMFNKVEKPDPNFITKITTDAALKYWIRLIVDGYFRLYRDQAWVKCKLVDDYNDQYHDNNNICLQFARDQDPDTEIIGKTISDVKQSFWEWSSDDSRKWSAKQYKNAVWDLYKIGIGKGKIDGQTRRVFMYQKSTEQVLDH